MDWLPGRFDMARRGHRRKTVIRNTALDIPLDFLAFRAHFFRCLGDRIISFGVIGHRYWGFVPLHLHVLFYFWWSTTLKKKNI
jgi:hypothetical protein